MGRGTIQAGTSGYSYKEWKGAFYPEKLAAAQYLKFYAERFSTVEINNTFYRFPSARVLESWRAETPEGFTFAVKANQGITHRGQLKEVEQLTRDFVERCGVLHDKLGPVLFQLPPTLRRDDGRLQAFLDGLPVGRRYAVEFRHATWFDDTVYGLLSSAGVALCISEEDKLATPRAATAGYCYIRLRKDAYTDDELANWRSWIDSQAAEGRDVFVYLKHDTEGESPERALRLLMPGC